MRAQYEFLRPLRDENSLWQILCHALKMPHQRVMTGARQGPEAVTMQLQCFGVVGQLPRAPELPRRLGRVRPCGARVADRAQGHGPELPAAAACAVKCSSDIGCRISPGAS